MIIVKFEKGQGLGNQLFNYISGLGIAKILKYKLGIINYNLFKGKDFLKLKNFNKVNIRRVKNFFFEERFYIKELKSYNYNYDDSVFKIKKNTLISGSFQSEQYFKNIRIDNNIVFEKKIFNRIFIKYSKLNFDNSCILNIRGGEFKNKKYLVLPKIYWMNCINFFKKKKISNFYIVTDDKKYASSMFPNIKIIGDTIAECYYLLLNSKNVIISNSSFSYFPLMSFKKKKILAPLYWGRFDNNLKIWVSLSNVYKNFNYVDQIGNILNKKYIKKTYNKNLVFLNQFKVKTNYYDLDKSLIKKILPKKIIKMIRFFRYRLNDI